MISTIRSIAVCQRPFWWDMNVPIQFFLLHKRVAKISNIIESKSIRKERKVRIYLKKFIIRKPTQTILSQCRMTTLEPVKARTSLIHLA